MQSHNYVSSQGYNLGVKMFGRKITGCPSFYPHVRGTKQANLRVNKTYTGCDMLISWNLLTVAIT